MGNISIGSVYSENAVQEFGKLTSVIKSNVHKITTEPAPLPTGKNGTLAVSIQNRGDISPTTPADENVGNLSAIVVTQNNGKVSFFHSPSGILLTPPGTVGFNNCSSLETTSEMIAIGLKSGRIAIHNSISLDLVKLIDPLFLYETLQDKNKIERHQSTKDKRKSNIFKAGHKNTLKDIREKELTMNNSPIDDMLFLHGGEIIIAMRENKTITIYDLRGSGVTVKDYLQIPKPVSPEKKNSRIPGEVFPPNEDQLNYVSYLIGSFSSEVINPKKTFADPNGIWGNFLYFIFYIFLKFTNHRC